MKQYKLFGIGLSVVFFLIFLFMVFYNNFVLISVDSYDMYFAVADKMGFNTDTDALYFGKTYPGGTSERRVNITNSNTFPVVVSISISGNISSHASISENDFIVMPNETKPITFYVTAGKDTPVGSSFKGKTRIVTRRQIF